MLAQPSYTLVFANDMHSSEVTQSNCATVRCKHLYLHIMDGSQRAATTGMNWCGVWVGSLCMMSCEPISVLLSYQVTMTAHSYLTPHEAGLPQLPLQSCRGVARC
jgi:hypothetical protein